MKKKAVVRMILGLALATLLLCGCGNSTDGATTSEDVPEVVEPVEAPDTEEKEEVNKPAEEEENKQEEMKQEEAEEEPVNEPEGETYNGMPVAQVATTVSDIYAFLDYAEALSEPALLIYNESEGYVINMGEGEYYQLQSDDRIFEYLSEKEDGGSSDTLEAGGGNNIAKSVEDISYVYEMKPDYSQYDKPHKVIYKVFFEGREKYFLLTCYLDAPTD